MLLAAVVPAERMMVEEAMAAMGTKQAARAAAAAAAQVAVRHEKPHQASKLALHSKQCMHLDPPVCPDQDMPLQSLHLGQVMHYLH